MAVMIKEFGKTYLNILDTNIKDFLNTKNDIRIAAIAASNNKCNYQAHDKAMKYLDNINCVFISFTPLIVKIHHTDQK